MMKYIKLCLIVLCLFAPFFIGVDTVYADTITDDSNIYTFEFQEPPVGDNSMYIVFLLEKIETGVRVPILQYCSITPRYTTDSNEYDWSDDVFFSVYLGSSQATIYFNSSSTTVARGYSYRQWYSGSVGIIHNDTFTTQSSCVIDFNSLGGFKCVGYEIIGSNVVIESGLGTRETFTYMFSDEITQYDLLLDILQEIALNNELTADELDILASILEVLQEQDTSLDSIITKLSLLLGDTDQLEYYLDLIYKNVNNIYNNTDKLEEYTDQLEYYLDLVYKNTNNILNNIDDVEELLQDLIDIFTPKDDESKYPEVDTSKQDQYIEIGKDLTSNDTTNEKQDLNIEVNNNASGYVWNVFNAFISSNAKVIGMYITLLSCAFVALILGR